MRVTADVLGWGVFQSLLARFAATPYGRDLASTLAPATDLAAVHAALAETGEARRALTAEGWS